MTKPVTKKAPLTANTDIGSVFDKSDVGNKDHRCLHSRTCSACNALLKK